MDWRSSSRLRRNAPAIRRLLVLAAVVAVLLFDASFVRPSPAAADTGDVGYLDQSFSGTQDPTGTKRAESLLWFNDGSWWASMWDVVSGDFHIFRLDVSTQAWRRHARRRALGWHEALRSVAPLRG
jgi:hypothetical protein